METDFQIENDSGLAMEIIHEPECWEFQLPPGEEVTIITEASKESICLSISLFEGKISVRVLDHKSLYDVRYKGNDAFKEYRD